MEAKLILVLVIFLEFSNEAEVRSYFVNLLPNEKHSKVEDLNGNHNNNNNNNNNNNKSSSQVSHSSPQRSVVNVLEEKQQMLDDDLSKLKDHLTKIEWKFNEILQQKKHAEKANEDLKWAVGSLRKSVLNIENDVIQFKNDQKNSVVDLDEFRDLELLRLSVTSLQGRMERLEKEEKRREEALTNIWTYIKSFAVSEKNQVRHGHHYHNHNYPTNQNKETLKNLITSNELPEIHIAPSPSSSSPSSGESRPNLWTAKLLERLSSLEGKVQDLNLRQESDKKSVLNQEDLLLAKFDQLQTKMMNMKNDMDELKSGEKQRKMASEEMKCYKHIQKAKNGGEYINQFQESSTIVNRNNPEMEDILKRMEDLQSKVVILQLNSTIKQTNEVNQDLKHRLELAHVAFQSSELANQMFLIISTVNRLSREFRMLKANSSHAEQTNLVKMADIK